MRESIEFVRAYPPDEPSGRVTASTETTATVDDCECDGTSLIEGVPLSGSPTVCCTGHERFSIAFGSIGSYTLYHAGGDVWSTYHADSSLDNPFSLNCGSGPDDDYDLVMDVSTGTITLEARAALNCEPLCLLYQRLPLFKCKQKNKFELVKFSGAADLALPLCVCVAPVVVTASSENACAGAECPDLPDTILADFGDTIGLIEMELIVGSPCRYQATENGCGQQIYISNKCGMNAQIRDNTFLTAYAYWIKSIPGDCECEGEIDVPHSLGTGAGAGCSGGYTAPGTVTVYFPSTYPPSDSGHCNPCGY